METMTLLEGVKAAMRKEIQEISYLFDYYSIPILEGDYLTYDWFEEGMSHNFLKREIPDEDEREDYMHRVMFIVKKDESGFFYGEGYGFGVGLYLHGFRFRYTKIIRRGEV